jgi:hypothetical protein
MGLPHLGLWYHLETLVRPPECVSRPDVFQYLRSIRSHLRSIRSHLAMPYTLWELFVWSGGKHVANCKLVHGGPRMDM